MNSEQMSPLPHLHKIQTTRV